MNKGASSPLSRVTLRLSLPWQVRQSSISSAAAPYATGDTTQDSANVRNPRAKVGLVDQAYIETIPFIVRLSQNLRGNYPALPSAR